jgi:hypothetical protein
MGALIFWLGVGLLVVLVLLVARAVDRRDRSWTAHSRKVEGRSHRADERPGA